MRRMLVVGLAALSGLAGWANAANAEPLSATGPVIAMSLADGLGANESGPYRQPPPGKAPSLAGTELVLVNGRQPIPVNFPVTGPAGLAAEVAPDVLLSTATLEVTANLKQDKHLPANNPKKIAELIESMLPLFDFRHITQLAVARNWHLASPEQQSALVAEFKALLVHTYSMALTNYGDQAIEYKPLRIAPGQTDVTVKSTAKQPGAEPMTIDYDMEKARAGWKIYDIKIAGISLIATYRSTFAQIIRDSGVNGLIKSLSATNQQADSGREPRENGAQPLLFIYAVVPSVLRGAR